MTVYKMSISLAPSLSSAVRDAAEQSGETLSGWLADAAQKKLRAQALDEFLDVWESENGAITEGDFEMLLPGSAPLSQRPTIGSVLLRSPLREGATRSSSRRSLASSKVGARFSFQNKTFLTYRGW